MFPIPLFKRADTASVVASGPTYTTIIYDTFTDTDGVHLHDHVLDINTPAVSWTDVTNVAVIGTNAVPGNNFLFSINPGVADARISFTYKTGNSGTEYGIQEYRYYDANNNWVISALVHSGATNTYNLSEITSGVTTIRAAEAYTFASNTQYAFVIEVNGNDHKITRDGVHELTYSSASHKTRTKIRFYMVNDGSPDNILDTFKVESITA